MNARFEDNNNDLAQNGMILPAIFMEAGNEIIVFINLEAP